MMDSILNLSEVQRKAYNLIYNEMRKGSQKVKLPGSISKQEMSLLVKLVLGDNPELMNFDNCNIRYSSIGFSNILGLQTIFNPLEARRAQARFDDEIKIILNKIIKPNTNVIQKALAIHDYLIQNVKYDEAELHRSSWSAISHVAYGAIVNKCAVCEGIAYAFSLLAKRVGINCTVVNGISDGNNHSWNIVKIGNEYYHIDVTGDLRQSESDTKSYIYFCVTDNDLKDRKWDRKIYPQCSSSKFNYFTVTKSYAHSELELRDMMLRQYKKNNSLYFKFDFIRGTEDEITDYVWNLFLDVANKNGLSVGQVMVSLNKKQSVFIMEPKK